MKKERDYYTMMDIDLMTSRLLESVEKVPAPSGEAYKELKGTQCHLATKSINTTGYCLFRMYGYKRKYHGCILMHRYVLERKLGRPIRKGELARHRCDRRACLNPEHIEEGTYTDNMRDGKKRGKIGPGKNGAKRKYSDEFMKNVSRLIREGYNNKEISEMTGINRDYLATLKRYNKSGNMNSRRKLDI